MKSLQILIIFVFALSLGACASTNAYSGYGHRDAKAGDAQAPFDSACASFDSCY